MHKPMPLPSLKVEGVHLQFGGLSVLRDINLQVSPGEVLALIGPNGAGKSALLNCITRVYRAAGDCRIELGGRRIDRTAAHKLRALGLSRTFQHVHLVAEMNAIDNVLLGLNHTLPTTLAHLFSRCFRQRAGDAMETEQALEMLKLCGVAEHYLRIPAALMPLGIRRRVDLARALVSKPSVLLLDEPASGLSHEERSLIPELISVAQAQRNLAVIWIEHDLDLVLSHADRVVVLHHGKVIRDTALKADPESRAAVIQAYMTGV